MANVSKTNAEPWLTGGGEMGAFLRSHLAHTTDPPTAFQARLGAIETWPPSLKTALSIMLHAEYPTFLVWGGDRLLFYNDAYCLQLTEGTSLILCGQSIATCWKNGWEWVRSDVEQVFSTGQPLHRAQEPPVNQDKGTGELCRWAYSALWDETGHVEGVFGAGYPVHPQPVQRCLQEAVVSPAATKTAFQIDETKFRQLVNSNLIGIVVANRECILEANEVVLTMVGYTCEDLIAGNIHWAAMTPPEYAPLDQHALMELQTLGKCTPFEKEYIRKDGSRVPILIGATVLQEDPLTCLCFILDLSERKQAEARLRQSEQRFREIAQTVRQLFFVRSATTGEFSYVSPAFEQIWGQSCESLYENPQVWQDAIHPDDRALVTQSLTEQFSGHPVQREYRIIRPDGEIRWIFAQINLVCDEAGNPLRFIGFAKDVSDRKHLEQSLINSRNFLELIFNEAGDALFLVDSDTLLTLDCNQQAIELFEVASKAELLQIEGHNLQKRQFTPDEMAMIQQEINDKRAWSLEVEYVTRKGREFWGDLSVKQLTFGNQRFNLVRVTDISDRKAAEFALQQSEARYLAILEDQTEMITRFKPDGTLLFVNDAYCRLFGVLKEQIIGSHYQPLIYPEDQPAIDRCLAALSPENPVGVVENRIVRRGELLWTQWTNRAIYNAQGNLIELQSVGRDIHDRKQAELKVQAALAEKEVLLQEVYHRVKNNLQLIQSMLQMQQRRLRNPEAVQALQEGWNRVMTISLVHEILYQSDNLAQINLKDYIPALVHHIAASYHSSAPGVMVKTEIQPIVIPMKKTICCGLILNELVTNALKYAFPKGRTGLVEVKLSSHRLAAGCRITMTVSDNGVGLSNPIQFADSKTLGLTLVQDFVDQLRGAITAESNQGSQFCITFELKDDPITRKP